MSWFPHLHVLVVLLFTLQGIVNAQYDVNNCPAVDSTFELITGWMYSAPQDILETRAGTLQLPDCLNACRNNQSCQAVNFETGLCVLFRSQAGEKEGKENYMYFFGMSSVIISVREAKALK